MQQTKPTAAHLSYFRKHFALTVGQAAALADVSRVTWSRWENGHTPVPGHMIYTLRGMGMWLKEQKEKESAA